MSQVAQIEGQPGGHGMAQSRAYNSRKLAVFIFRCLHDACPFKDFWLWHILLMIAMILCNGL